MALEGPKGLIGSPERKEWEAKFSDVPEELFGKARWLNYGAPEPKLIESAQAEREGEIAAYSGILDALKAADAEASQDIRELAENTRDMTYEADITTGSLMDLGSAADNTGAAFYNAIRDTGNAKKKRSEPRSAQAWAEAKSHKRTWTNRQREPAGPDGAG